MTEPKPAATTTVQVYREDADWLKTRQRKASFTTESGVQSGWIPMFDLIHALIEFVREAEGEGALTMITVRRPSGLTVPFEPPELTIGASIERSCETSDGGLMVPKQPEYLPTYPVYNVPAVIRAWHSWADYYDHRW
jgi:hypothetical protein